MLEVKEEELKKILPSDGPSIDEVKRYLEKYNDEYIVIKCGGSVLVDQNLFNIFIKDITTLNKLGFIPIIVHGGGKRISNKLNELGINSEFIKGLRVTGKETIEVVENILIVSFPVTRSPLVNLLSIPNSFNLLLILLPPPCTTIGINPNLLSVVISFIKILNKF